MSRLASWFLIPPVNARLSERYRLFSSAWCVGIQCRAWLFLDDYGLDVHSA